MIDPGKPSPPRFPFAAATFCAACVGVATWLFFRWSYAWDVTPAEMAASLPQTRSAAERPSRPDERWLGEGAQDAAKWRGRKSSLWPPRVWNPACRAFLGSYVTVRGENVGPPTFVSRPETIVVSDRVSPARRVCVCLDAAEGSARGACVFTGRVVLLRYGSPSYSGYYFAVDTTRSRWTGESVAGLAVGAMGVLIFGMTLRHWLARRRASGGQGKEAGP